MAFDIWSLASAIAKFTLYMSTFGLSGSILFKMVFKQGHKLLSQHHLIYLCLIALLATVLSFSLRSASLTGDMSGMIDAEILSLLWQTPVGDVLIYRSLGLVLICISLLLTTGQSLMSILGIGLLLGSFSQIGHALDLETPWITVLFFIHFACIAFWVGALVPLYKAANGALTLDETAIISERFGQIAMAAVPVLLIAGGIMSFLLVGNFENLFTSTYGQALLIKVALVSALLSLAAANKFRFVPRLKSGQSNATKQLAKSIKLEGALVIIIFAVTAILTSGLSLPMVM